MKLEILYEGLVVREIEIGKMLIKDFSFAFSGVPSQPNESLNEVIDIPKITRADKVIRDLGCLPRYEHEPKLSPLVRVKPESAVVEAEERHKGNYSNMRLYDY